MNAAHPIAEDLLRAQDREEMAKRVWPNGVAIALWMSSGLAQVSGPEPAGWYAGDPHVHRGLLCARDNERAMLSPSELVSMMSANRLAVLPVLGDLGNGEIRFASEDLPLVNGSDHAATAEGRILHFDAEWHFDPAGVTFDRKAIGGHLILLGLRSAQAQFHESTRPVIEMARAQGAVAGFAHMQYLPEGLPDKLDCCTPLEYPVEVALTPGTFVMEDVNASESAMRGYYRLLNCGLRPGLAAGTDYPCYAKGPVALGDLLTYVRVEGERLTYRGWIDGIAAGRTVISANGHREFTDLKVANAGPGEVIELGRGATVEAVVRWTADERISGAVELVKDGRVIGRKEGRAGPAAPMAWRVAVRFEESGWLAVRRMKEGVHAVHTAAVFVEVGKQPVRASSGDANYFVRFIDMLLERTSEGGAWAGYFPKTREAVRARYREARAYYARVEEEARRAGR